MINKFYELQIEIEPSCILDCVHCSSLETRSKSTLINEKDLIKLISMFKSGVHIYFTGGEPLLKKDIINLFQSITYENPNAIIGVYTTGNLNDMLPISETMALNMKNSGVFDCYFSIYSNSQIEHDAWTRSPGSFENTIASIHNTIGVGIHSKAHIVLNKHNCTKIDELIDFCASLGLEEIRILKLSPSGAAIYNWSNIGIPSGEQDFIISKLIKSQGERLPKLTFSGYPSLYPCRALPGAIGCQAGARLLYIDIDGDVYPCACAKANAERYRIGNLEHLNDIINYIKSVEGVSHYTNCLNEGFEM